MKDFPRHTSPIYITQELENPGELLIKNIKSIYNLSSKSFFTTWHIHRYATKLRAQKYLKRIIFNTIQGEIPQKVISTLKNLNQTLKEILYPWSTKTLLKRLKSLEYYYLPRTFFLEGIGSRIRFYNIKKLKVIDMMHIIQEPLSQHSAQFSANIKRAGSLKRIIYPMKFNSEDGFGFF